MAYNVLIVDDSSVTRRVIRKALAMSGLPLGELQEAQDGEQALKMLEGSWIDIVFTDLNMPNMDGFELVKTIEESESLQALPVVVISSNRGEEQIARLKEMGVNSYLKKPFRPEQLREVVEKLLRSIEEGKNG